VNISRREFLKATGLTAAALGLNLSGLPGIREAMAAEGGPRVVWLQGQSCTGCSVSFLNSIYYTTVDDLLVNTLDVDYHPNLMAAPGHDAVAAAEAARQAGGYVLVVEGAIPTGDAGRYAYLWDGKTVLDGVREYAERAAYIMAVGTCACYGGLVAGAPNPTTAQGLRSVLPGRTIVNVPGCPVHPDWLVGTVAYILQNGRAPALDANGRPLDYFRRAVHENCPLKGTEEVDTLGQYGCLKEIGCRGPTTRADCNWRKWNSPGQGQVGVNWCAQAGAPCHGCTEPTFPDGMSPFFDLHDAGGD
jgi:NiFe hydrogenase small subunit HydA